MAPLRRDDGAVAPANARWALGSPRNGVGEAFAEAVEPDDLSPDLDGLREQ